MENTIIFFTFVNLLRSIKKLLSFDKKVFLRVVFTQEKGNSYYLKILYNPNSTLVQPLKTIFLPICKRKGKIFLFSLFFNTSENLNNSLY